jgi:hypothetical protein
MINYAMIDADGYFGGNKTYVYRTYTDRDAAIRAVKHDRRVQIIEGNDLQKGELIWGDSIGRVYPRVESD